MTDSRIPEAARAAMLDDGIDPETGEILTDENTPPEPPEPDESDPENAPEPEPQPEPLTPEKAEAIFAALERFKTTAAREVEKRAGVMFADLEPCPLCMAGGPAPGFFFPQLPEPDQSMRRLVLMQALGGDGQPEYPDDPDTETCDRCQGYGQTRTGSKASGQETRPCPGCSGQGWKAKTPAYAPPPVFALAAPAPQPFAPQPFTNGAADQWGRQVGHPHYGQNPALIGV